MKRLGDYTIVRELARGGMGVVYQARDAAGRDVALKSILGAPDEEHLRRFRREAEGIARIDHPGVVKIHGFERDERGRDFIVMSLIDGEPLSDVVAREHPLDADRAVGIARDLSDALAAAHAQGVLHRDVKPSNVLLGRADDRPVLTDFGLARLDDQSRLTQTGQTHGTPAYMPPEQADGALAQIGPASDVYGVGATLFHLLTGAPPFRGLTAINLLRAVLSDPPPSLATYRPDLSPSLDALVQRCLAKDPEQRYPSAEALRDALDRLRRDGLEPRSPRGKVGIAAITLALLGAVALALSGGAWHRSAPAPAPGPPPRAALPEPPTPPSSARAPDEAHQPRELVHPAWRGLPPRNVGVCSRPDGTLVTWALHAKNGTTVRSFSRSCAPTSAVWRFPGEEAPRAVAARKKLVLLLTQSDRAGPAPRHLPWSRLVVLHGTGEAETLPTRPGGALTSAALSADGTRVAVGSRRSKGKVKQTDLHTWGPDGLGPALILRAHRARILDMAFTPSGELLVVSGHGTKAGLRPNDQRLVQFDAQGRELGWIPNPAMMPSLATDGRRCLFGDTFGLVQEVSLPLRTGATPKLFVRRKAPTPLAVSRAAIESLELRGERLFVRTGRTRGEDPGAPGIRIYELRTRRLLGGITQFPNLASIDVSPNGRWLALGLRTVERDGVAAEVWPVSLLTSQPPRPREGWPRRR